MKWPSPSPSQPPTANDTEEASQIFFASTLSSRYRGALETLMFFNPHQGKLRNAISQLVDRYGNPKIVKEGELLRLQIGLGAIAQTLFCFDGNQDLIGVVVYIREFREYLTIIHLVVHEDYSMSGSHSDQFLVLRLIQKVQEIGARIKGVEAIEILYDQSLKKIPIRH